MPFAATWMDLEIIIPNEMSDRERQILSVITYMWNLKYTDELICKTDSETEKKILWLPKGKG